MTTTNRPWPKVWPDFIGKWPRLTGRQQPEIEVWHEGDESEGDRCVKFGVKIGLRCMPWEWMIVRAVLSLLLPNEWGVRLYTHRNVVIECTRQQGKTLILILLILWKLFKRRRRIVYTAQQWATVEDVFDRVVAIIDRVPSLKKRLAKPPSKKDNRGTIVLKPIRGDKHVVKADFGPRTQHFARGFTEVDDLILDEAYDLVPKETANLTGAQAASENPQTIYASTPPVVSEHPNCGRFSGFVRTIVAGGAPGLYGVLYRAPKHFKRGDPAAYPLAQPSYGVVGDDREMEAHLQGAKDAGPVDLALFDADWLGWGDYPPPPGAAVSEIATQAWTDMDMAKRPGSAVTGPTALVIERSPDRSLWVLIAAQRTTDGRVHIEVGYARAAPPADVVAKVVSFVTECDPIAVVVRGGRSGPAELLPALTAAKLDVTTATPADVAHACGGFLSAALAPGGGLLSHSGQAQLDAAVARAVKKDLPGDGAGFVWEIADEASWPMLMGASLAHWAVVSFGQPEEAPPKPAAVTAAAQGLQVDRGPDPWGAIDFDFDPMTASF